MKRIFASAVLLTACLLLLPACAPATNDPGEPSVPPPPPFAPEPTVVVPPELDPVEIVVWEEAGAAAEFIRRAGELFSEQASGVHVRVVEVDPGDVGKWFVPETPEDATVYDGPAPDLFAAPRDSIIPLVNGGHIRPVIAENTVSAQILDVCRQALTLNDTLYGYPLSVDTGALYYNKALIANPPETWDEVKSFCEGADIEGGAGFVMDVTDPYLTALFLSSNGNYLFGPRGLSAERPGVNTASAVFGMEVFAALGTLTGLPASELSGGQAAELFRSGQAAMLIADSGAMPEMKRAGVDFDVAPVPALPGDNAPASTLSVTRGLFLSSESQNALTAAIFCEFLLTPEIQALRVEMCGGLPAVHMENEGPYQGFGAQLVYAYPLSPLVYMENFEDAMTAAAVQIWEGGDIPAALDHVLDALMG